MYYSKSTEKARAKAIKQLCRKRTKKENIFYGYIFIAPVIVGMLIFTFWPLLESFYTSFTEYDNVSPHVWVGFENYSKILFQQGEMRDMFIKALGNTLVYAVVSIPVNIVCSFFLALLVNNKLRFVKVFRALFYIPCILPMAASVLVFKEMFSYNGGLFNQFLVLIGLPKYGFFSTAGTAMPSLIFYSMWNMGASMLIWLSAFNSVPKDLYEASGIDGAGAFGKLIHVTVPLVTGTIFYNVIMGIIGGLQIFAQAQLFNGPEESTTTVVVLLYRYGMGYNEMGVASAMSWVLALVIMFFTAMAFLSKKLWVYGE